ncbi:MAG: multifunctional CCA tRNA nucleotidyl transferase/2'3'-cyclic phosphodiesterase/2'nucleotidase/phosphatase [Halieaceae bacterium]|jgi:tRNA nucleotidyltransferase (CCA-adding enzyme)|nr:multifunctional CCA tRNA nucleotidyl transferase/2'3'-cyclic phosphodiesterase/2'nucleotidase/phosphatase [Halieaceae bacterium]
MKTFLVGGAVRDRLLGLDVQERDWVVVGATPKEMEALGFRQVGRDFPVFLHPETGEEYALARTERKRGHGHRGFEVHSDPGVTLEEDLRRRDLTINAMAETDEGTLIDPYDGQVDLAERCLRHVSDAFVEDPLRVLRVARFAARFAHLGFTVADETLALMRRIADSGELLTLSAERLWSETLRALETDSPWVYLDVLERCGATAALLPEITSLDRARQALRRVVDANGDSGLRFSAMLSGLAPEAAERVCLRLNAPRRFRELALLWVQQADALQRATTAEAVLGVLEQSDALRRPERFAALLEAYAALREDARVDFWQRAQRCFAGVDAAAIAAQGHPGHEIAARLREQRLQALQALISA